MSRLQPLFIPFAGGANDQVDKRLLPNGVFAEVQNGRIPAAGSLRLRRGWRPITMRDLASNDAVTACDLYSYQDSLIALTSNVSDQAMRLSVFANTNTSRPWVDANIYSALSPVTRLRAVGNSPALSTSVLRASAAITSDGVYGCVLQQTATQSVVRVFKMATDETVAYAELANGSRVRKVVSMATKFGLVENTGSALVLWTLDPTANAPAFTSTATLVTATVTWFDVCAATESTPLAIHLTDVIAGAVSYRKFSFAGVQSGSTKTVSASGAEAAAIACDDVTADVVYQDSTSHELSILTFAATGSFTTSQGPTAIDAGAAIVTGLFSVALSQGVSPPLHYVAAEGTTLGADGLRVNNYKLTSGHSVSTYAHKAPTQLYGGIITRGFVNGIGVVRRTNTTTGGTGSTSQYTDERAPWCIIDYGIGAVISGLALPFWPGVAPTGDVLVIAPRDTTPISGTTPLTIAVRSFKLRSTERRPGVQLGGALYITGGILGHFVGALVESGMQAPRINSLATANDTGTIANGTYSYRAVMVWEDSKQRTHRSIVAESRDATLAGADDTVTASINVVKSLRRNFNLVTNPRVELYRTEAGPGELFYLVGSGTVNTDDDAVSIKDTLPDASIITQPLLYTQGETGAVSGILDQAPPRPSAYITATKRRLWLGSADTSYQASQVTLPDIPVFFAEPGVSGDAAQAYFDDVEGGRITAAFALDEQVFMATAERIYLTGGAGPNLAGVGGEFAPPQALPVDVGVYDWRSVLPVGDGVWFRGSATRMYLLPRGAAQPSEQRAVQEHLTSALNIVGAGYDSADGVGVWALDNATALVRMTALDLWTSDTLPFTPVALIDHAGHLYAVASDGVVWAQDSSAFGDGSAGATAPVLRVATGPVQVFDGTAGHGRLACVELMGEFQAAATVLGEISYDDGLTWTSLGSYSVTGLSAGETFQRQWYPARQRGGRFRLRFTMTPTVATTEGCRLAGCVAYFTKASGQTRLGSANRK